MAEQGYVTYVTEKGTSVITWQPGQAALYFVS